MHARLPIASCVPTVDLNSSTNLFSSQRSFAATELEQKYITSSYLSGVPLAWFISFHHEVIIMSSDSLYSAL